MIRPNHIDLDVSYVINWNTSIDQIAKNDGVTYETDEKYITDESVHQANQWLMHHMATTSPFHKLCYNSSVNTTKSTIRQFQKACFSILFTLSPIIIDARCLHPLKALSPMKSSDLEIRMN